MVVICNDCEQDRVVTSSCTASLTSLNGRNWLWARYGAGHIDAVSASNGIRCPGCGVLPGDIHHGGCSKGNVPDLWLPAFLLQLPHR